MRTPELFSCTLASFENCCRELAALGLEPDRKHAHLIPFRNNKQGTVECTLIIGYQGLAELVRRVGDVEYIHADVAYLGDVFDYAYGTGAFLRHKPGENRTGAPLHFYSFVRFKGGAEDFTVMSKAEVDRIRERSKSKDRGPWQTDYDEMGKKTAFRRHSKWLPVSAEIRRAIERGSDDAVSPEEWTDTETGEVMPGRPPAGGSLRDKIMTQPSFLDPAETIPDEYADA
jgi:recombination protein RecT